MALKSLIESSLGTSGMLSFDELTRSKELAGKFFASQSEKSEALEILARDGLDAEAISAEAFVLKEKIFLSLDKMIERNERRRDRTLRDIAYYRQNLAEVLEPLTRRLMEEGAPEIESRKAA